MTDHRALEALLGRRVTVTNPDMHVSWIGTLVALADHPALVLDQDDGHRLVLPQAFDVALHAREIRRITVDVPVNVPNFDALWTAVADAAYDWEPEDRDGWDTAVAATVIDLEEDA